jgi:low temperature requirement protein LtrA
MPAPGWHRPMAARGRQEPARVATPLEAFFDLCFVVAVAAAGAHLHHALALGRVGHGLIGYVTVFFAIWWAWMNFTWFASAYDTDDVPYRVATFVQITGALMLAAGVPRAFEAGDLAVVTVGYVVMRVAMAAQWLRAAYSDLAGRRVALRYATGIWSCQVGWVSALALPAGMRSWALLVLIPAEVAVPVWAERRRQITWHPHHIAERYGLFTLIVLGESVAAATTAFQTALDARQTSATLYADAAGGLLTVFSMWWLYFAKPAHRLLTSNRVAFVWGYGHYLVFASAAAVGAGLATNVDEATGHAELSRAAAGATVTVPVAVFLLSVWFLHVRPHHAGAVGVLLPGGAAVVAVATFAGLPVVATGGLLAATVALSVVIAARTEPAV